MPGYHFARINWTKKSPKSVLDIASNVLDKTKDNPRFPSLPVTTEVFSKQLSRLQNTYNNRRCGKMSTLQLSYACTVMDDTLRQYASYVTQVAKGDSLIIETSGFEASKGSYTKVVLPDMPVGVRLSSRNGKVHLVVRKPKGAASLCWVIYYGEVISTAMVNNNILNLPVNTGAKIINAGKSREVLYGLPAGTKVTAHVLAQNAAGCSALSHTASVYVNH